MRNLVRILVVALIATSAVCARQQCPACSRNRHNPEHPEEGVQCSWTWDQDHRSHIPKDCEDGGGLYTNIWFIDPSAMQPVQVPPPSWWPSWAPWPSITVTPSLPPMNNSFAAARARAQGCVIFGWARGRNDSSSSRTCVNAAAGWARLVIEDTVAGCTCHDVTNRSEIRVTVNAKYRPGGNGQVMGAAAIDATGSSTGVNITKSIQLDATPQGITAHSWGQAITIPLPGTQAGVSQSGGGGTVLTAPAPSKVVLQGVDEKQALSGKEVSFFRSSTRVSISVSGSQSNPGSGDSGAYDYQGWVTLKGSCSVCGSGITRSKHYH